MADTRRSVLIAARLHNQSLLGAQAKHPAAIVSRLGAVQSQDYAGGTWGIGLRCAGVARADVDAAFDSGAILRTHVMRPTWHFVAPADIRWMLSLTAPRVHAIGASYLRKDGLTARVLSRCHALLERALRGRPPQTRAELSAALKQGNVNATGNRLGLIMMNAELEALICSGPRRGKQFTYAWLPDRAPDAKDLPRESALTALAARYFHSHGPATAKDFAWWSGLTLKDANAGIEANRSSLAVYTLDGLTYYSPPLDGVRARATTFLLPNYDEFLIAYRDRGLSVMPGDGMDNPIFSHQIVVDGFVVGSWSRTIGGTRAAVAVKPYSRFTAADMARVKKAADAYGRFLQLPIEVG